MARTLAEMVATVRSQARESSPAEAAAEDAAPGLRSWSCGLAFQP